MGTNLQKRISNLFLEMGLREKNDFESILEAYYLKKYHLDRLIHVAERVFPYIKPGSKVLDLGSDGIFPCLAKIYIEDVEAYAISKWYDKISIADDGRAFSEMISGLDPVAVNGKNTVTIHKCDLNSETLPYDDNSIDILTCFEVLEHIYSDPMNLMLEAKRVLRKDTGIFFLSTPNINSYKALKRAFCLESPYFWPPYSKTDSEIGHVKEYSINELKLLFKESGFTIIDLETFNHKEDEFFSHDKQYRSGNKLDLRVTEEQSDNYIAFEEFMKSNKWDYHLRGDYTLIMSKANNDEINRYYFPLYESY